MFRSANGEKESRSDGFIVQEVHEIDEERCTRPNRAQTKPNPINTIS